jgi:hypothetical protein
VQWELPTAGTTEWHFGRDFGGSNIGAGYLELFVSYACICRFSMLMSVEACLALELRSLIHSSKTGLRKNSACCILLARLTIHETEYVSRPHGISVTACTRDFILVKFCVQTG